MNKPPRKNLTSNFNLKVLWVRGESNSLLHLVRVALVLKVLPLDYGPNNKIFLFLNRFCLKKLDEKVLNKINNEIEELLKEL